MNSEQTLEQVYPSIAEQSLGRFVGRVMGSLSFLPAGVVRSAVALFVGTLLLPISVLSYALQKIRGSYYELTNQALKKRNVIGGKITDSVALAQIHEIRIEHRSGQSFLRAGDLVIMNDHRHVLMKLPGVPLVERVRDMIQTQLDVHRQMEESRQQILSRTPTV